MKIKVEFHIIVSIFNFEDIFDPADGETSRICIHSLGFVCSSPFEFKFSLGMTGLLDPFKPNRFALEIFIEFATDESYDYCYILVFVEFCSR